MVTIFKQWGGKSGPSAGQASLHLKGDDLEVAHIIVTCLNGKSLVKLSQVAVRESGNYNF